MKCAVGLIAKFELSLVVKYGSLGEITIELAKGADGGYEKTDQTVGLSKAVAIVDLSVVIATVISRPLILDQYMEL